LRCCPTQRAGRRTTPIKDGTGRCCTIQPRRKVGRREWQKESGYRQQARVENGFFRYKSVIGVGLKARNSNAQTGEVMIGCHALNRMAELGRPESYATVS